MDSLYGILFNIIRKYTMEKVKTRRINIVMKKNMGSCFKRCDNLIWKSLIKNIQYEYFPYMSHFISLKYSKDVALLARYINQYCI